MKKIFTVIIEGEGADEAAEELVKLTKKIGTKRELPKSQKGSRSFDYIAFVDFFAVTASVVITIGGPIQTAYTIWQWRRTIKQDASIRKEIGSEEEELILREDGKKEEIESFLSDSNDELDKEAV